MVTEVSVSGPAIDVYIDEFIKFQTINVLIMKKYGIDNREVSNGNGDNIIQIISDIICLYNIKDFYNVVEKKLFNNVIRAFQDRPLSHLGCNEFIFHNIDWPNPSKIFNLADCDKYPFYPVFNAQNLTMFQLISEKIKIKLVTSSCYNGTITEYNISMEQLCWLYLETSDIENILYAEIFNKIIRPLPCTYKDFKAEKLKLCFTDKNTQSI